jgi:hypothetical protein
VTSVLDKRIEEQKIVYLKELLVLQEIVNSENIAETVSQPE